ncbi:PREDICTED: uncharacterized protein LOC109344948 [Lupinus angustifolius]|uniref:uncharacterized protein LOC109344948 n=1 Tax=Lupinus angustifolius TaxID=3871 RepID=UPI00092F505B|nr:PREDICTED: uncharacterized protein LOC109344948 [Lupinus angustifolius]
MGLSEVAEGSFESADSKKWVIAGIGLRAALKPIYTIPFEKKKKLKKKKKEREEEEEESEYICTTPTSLKSRIPTMLSCPPAPMKRKSSGKCDYRGVVKELFTATPHDLETVFMQRVKQK